MSTFMAKASIIEPKWLLIDAADQVVGRLAVVISTILRGKHRPQYTPHCDTGDFVVIINADKVKFTGNKWESKEYHHYTHYAGGLRRTSAKQMLAKKPEEILIQAVKRMVPRNKLGRQQMSKLKVYANPNHPHAAQQPEVFDVSSLLK
jgi:large subunit ribosomal protein L13